jgi:hypothetical protein
VVVATAGGSVVVAVGFGCCSLAVVLIWIPPVSGVAP